MTDSTGPAHPVDHARAADPGDLAEIVDLWRIQQLLVAYTVAIDGGRFTDLDTVFTTDAYIDYRAMGGIDGDYPAIRAWLGQVLPHFTRYAHMLGLPSIRLAGDTATARTFCFNPMVAGAAEGSEGADPATMLLGLWYDDDLVRDAGGWRIRRRVVTRCFAQTP